MAFEENKYLVNLLNRPEFTTVALASELSKGAAGKSGGQGGGSTPDSGEASWTTGIAQSCDNFVLKSTTLDVPGPGKSVPDRAGGAAGTSSRFRHVAEQASALSDSLAAIEGSGATTSPTTAMKTAVQAVYKRQKLALPAPPAAKTAQASASPQSQPAQFKAVTAPPKITGSPLNRWVLLSFFPLVRAIQRVSDHVGLSLGLQSEILDLLVGVLRDVPEFAFAEESVENLDIVQAMLLQHAAVEADAARRAQTLAAVFGLASQRGALQPLLEVLVVLMKEHAHASGAGEALLLHTAGYASQMVKYRQEQCGAVLVSKSMQVRIPLAVDLAIPSATSPAATSTQLTKAASSGGADRWLETLVLPADYAAQVMCGGFLYRHTREGLLKVGTGEAGTAPGYVYAERRGYRTHEPLSLAVVSGHLFVGKSVADDKAVFAVELHTETLLETSTQLSSGEAPFTPGTFRIVSGTRDSELFVLHTTKSGDVLVTLFDATVAADGGTWGVKLAARGPPVPLAFPWSFVMGLESVDGLTCTLHSFGVFVAADALNLVIPSVFLREPLTTAFQPTLTVPASTSGSSSSMRSLKALQLRFDVTSLAFIGTHLLCSGTQSTSTSSYYSYSSSSSSSGVVPYAVRVWGLPPLSEESSINHSLHVLVRSPRRPCLCTLPPEIRITASCQSQMVAKWCGSTVTLPAGPRSLPKTSLPWRRRSLRVSAASENKLWVHVSGDWALNECCCMQATTPPRCPTRARRTRSSCAVQARALRCGSAKARAMFAAHCERSRRRSTGSWATIPRKASPQKRSSRVCWPATPSLSCKFHTRCTLWRACALARMGCPSCSQIRALPTLIP